MPAKSLIATVCLFALGLSSCATFFPNRVFDHPLVTSASEESAEVYFIRPKKLDLGAFRLALYLEGEKLFRVRRGAYFHFHIVPGEYSVRVTTGPFVESTLFEGRLRFEAGGPAYVMVDPTVAYEGGRGGGGSVRLSFIEESAAESFLNRYRWANKPH